MCEASCPKVQNIRATCVTLSIIACNVWGIFALKNYSVFVVLNVIEHPVYLATLLRGWSPRQP